MVWQAIRRRIDTSLPDNWHSFRQWRQWWYAWRSRHRMLVMAISMGAIFWRLATIQFAIDEIISTQRETTAHIDMLAERLGNAGVIPTPSPTPTPVPIRDLIATAVERRFGR